MRNGRPFGLPSHSSASSLPLSDGDCRELELLDLQVGAPGLVAGHREGVLSPERGRDDIDPGPIAVIGGTGTDSLDLDRRPPDRLVVSLEATVAPSNGTGRAEGAVEDQH